MPVALHVRLVCLVLAAGCMVMLLQGGACGSMSVPERPLRPTPVQPQWSDNLLREHLRFLNGSDVDSRMTGTSGYVTAAAYVAARLEEFDIQPVLDTAFETGYFIRLHELTSGALTLAGPDTTSLYAGLDFLPDAQSDSGEWIIRTLWIDPAEAGTAWPEAPGPAVLLPEAKATVPYLHTLRAAGVRVVLIAGRLAPRVTSAPIAGLLVAQVTPTGAAHLLGTTPQAVESLLLGDARMRQALPRPATLRVVRTPPAYVEAINLLGFVAGKHPKRARELVIVATDMDNVGAIAGVSTFDADHLGIGTAALLEVARHYALFGAYGSVPERTVLFAVFSGGRQGHAGLRSYLRLPAWPLSQTRAVVYLGLDPQHAPDARALLAAQDILLYEVAPPPDTLASPGLLLIPERGPRRRTPEAGDELPRLADMITTGVVRARAMADSAHTLLLRETVTPAPFRPVAEDTLRAPTAQDN